MNVSVVKGFLLSFLMRKNVVLLTLFREAVLAVLEFNRLNLI